MDRATLLAEIQQEADRTREIRSNERDFKDGRINGGLITSRGNVKHQLKQVLNPKLAPSNVGPLSQVSWPFFYEFNFDFTDGADTVFVKDVTKKSSVQVSQEAGFICTSLYRDWSHEGQAGYGAPVSLDFRDNTSSRQLNDSPLQLQHIGFKGRPTKLPIPFLIEPNASMTINMTPWIDQTVLASTGKIKIIAQGVRVRKEGMEKALRDLISFY